MHLATIANICTILSLICSLFIGYSVLKLRQSVSQSGDGNTNGMQTAKGNNNRQSIN
ncbi:hypothetical protein BDW_13925 [Bdellovibrio bacteriovorus W]|nr:hypothetical protein BDW_13925 [Bdellovibrio bacteriovorus W]